MFKRIRLSLGAAAMVSLLLVALGALGLQLARDPSHAVKTAALALVRHEDASASEAYTENQALAAAGPHLDAQIARFLVTLDTQSDPHINSLQVDGHTLTSSDLERTGLRLERGATHVTDSYGGSYSSSEPQDVWVVEWRRAGIAVPEWGTDVELTAVLVIDANSGALKGAQVGFAMPE